MNGLPGKYTDSHRMKVSDWKEIDRVVKGDLMALSFI